MSLFLFLSEYALSLLYLYYLDNEKFIWLNADPNTAYVDHPSDYPIEIILPPPLVQVDENPVNKSSIITKHLLAVR